MKRLKFIGYALLVMISINNAVMSQRNSTSAGSSDTFFANLFSSHPSFFDSIISKSDDLNIQVIYTQIERKKSGKPIFSDHYFHLDKNHYFYPASTVKLPVAILALQRLNELNIPGLDLNTTMLTGADGDGQTEVNNDPSAADGRPTVAHYIKKILLVSDNDAFNRLYEWLGQEYINENLHRMGYTDIEIIHRLAISMNEAQNRHTNPVRFIDSLGKTLYEKPASKSEWKYAQRDNKVGKGFVSGSTVVNEPFDFSKKNRMSLLSLHRILQSVIFPDAVPADRRFNLTDEDYAFLRRYMSMRPSESRFPTYDTSEYWDNYAKMLLLGTEKTAPDSSIRNYSKSGWSYGFLTDAAYVVDFKNNIEFMVSAVIYCNADGILNDDNYDYKTVGYPFMKHLGQVLYEHELKRQRKRQPDISSFQFNYVE